MAVLWPVQKLITYPWKTMANPVKIWSCL